MSGLRGQATQGATFMAGHEGVGVAFGLVAKDRLLNILAAGFLLVALPWVLFNKSRPRIGLSAAATWRRSTVPAMWLPAVPPLNRDRGHPSEALACGTPVVSFDVGQIGPVLERDSRIGVLVRQRDPVGFAAALAQVLTRPFDPESRVHCAVAVRERTPERSLEDLLRRYQEWEEDAAAEANPPGPRRPEN
jgi:glycosyltransferase involved in cell wall biosynthesis